MKNENSSGLWIPLALAGMLASGMWIGFTLQRHNLGGAAVFSNTPQVGTVEEAIRYIETRYVDTMDRGKLTEAAIEAILHQLDPHSTYIPARNLNAVNESLEGNFEGVGIRFFLMNDTVLVLNIIKDGPSDKAGLQAGDRIVKINDTLVAGVKMPEDKIVSRLRGTHGSSVKVTIFRKNEGLKDFTIFRDEIALNSLEAAFMLDEKTGFIKISRFSGTTTEEFNSAIQRLIEKENMKHLVLDLRDNPGGYLSAATGILDQIFTDKVLLVYTNGRFAGRKEYKSSGHAHYRIDKVAILVDENSASASEIVAGAIQDHDRGVIVGRRSFGKGLVQEQYDLSDGSALRLTVARYFTPSGRCIQKHYSHDEDEYREDLEKRYEHGELKSADSIRISDSTVYHTSGGRVVYGGGGITPDIFVPIEDVSENPLFISAASTITEFVYQYWDQNRKRLAAEYKDGQTFIQTFMVPEAEFGKFLDGVKVKSKPYTPIDITLATPYLKTRFKADLARLLFDQEYYYRMFNMQDESLKAAIRAINDDDYRQRAMRIK